MPDFVVPEYKLKQTKHPVVCISMEAYAELEKMKSQTGVDIKQLASQAIIFASRNLRVKPLVENKED